MAHQNGATVIGDSGRLEGGYPFVLACGMCWNERLGGGNGGHAASRHAQHDAIGDLEQREDEGASRNQQQAVQGERMEID